MKKILFLSAALVAIAFAANAQAYCPPNAAPIDGGLSILLVAGVAGYATKKLAERTKKSDVETK